MSYILRSAGFTPGGSPSWPLSQPPCWRGFAGAPAPGFSAATIWWQPGDALALDFGNDRYMRDGEAASLAAVLSTSRTSPATWFMQAGVLRSFDVNVPAITDRGLYPGGQVTNLIPYSRDFDSWTPQGAAAVSADAATAPDGTVTADKLYIPTVETNTCQVTTNVTAANSTVYTYSVFAKMDGARWGSIALQSGFVSNGRAWFDLQNGVVGTKQAGLTSSSITAYADGWYRISVTFTSLGTAAGSRAIYVSAVDADNSTTLTSDGTNGQLLWGADLAASAFAAPPIVTEGAPATRLADSITIPDFAAVAAAFGFASGFAGRAIVDVDRLSAGAYRLLFDFGTDTSNRAYLAIPPNNTVELSIKAASAGPVLNTAALGSTGQYTLEWQVLSGDSFIKVNGTVAASSSTTFTMPSLTTGYIGQSRSGGSHLNGPLSELHLRGAAA